MNGKTISWQFSRPKHETLASRSIMFALRSEICHVDVETTDGRLLGAQVSDGIRIRDQHYIEFGLRIRVTLPVTDEQHSIFWEYAMSRVGEQYQAGGVLGNTLGMSIRKDGYEFCSELQANGVKIAGVLHVPKECSLTDAEQFRLIVSAPLYAVEERFTS